MLKDELVDGTGWHSIHIIIYLAWFDAEFENSTAKTPKREKYHLMDFGIGGCMFAWFRCCLARGLLSNPEQGRRAFTILSGDRRCSE